MSQLDGFFEDTQHRFQLINKEDWCLSKGIERKSVNKRTNIYLVLPGCVSSRRFQGVLTIHYMTANQV